MKRLLLLGLLCSGIAQDTIVLPETVIAPTRRATDVLEVPYTVQTISENDVRMLTLSRSLPEVLEEEASVLVQKTGHGQGSPFIRGFTAFRNLLLLDGVRINNSVFREGPNQYWNTVDFLSVKQFELVSGPGSVLYGSDAIGGTLSARTFDPNRPARNETYLRGSSAERSFMGRVDLATDPSDKLRLEGGFSYKTFGDLEGGKDVGTQKATGYDELDWDARAAWFLDEDAYVLLTHTGVQQKDAPRTHKTVNGIDWEGLSVGSELKRDLDQDRSLTALQLHGETLQLGISWQTQAEQQDRIRGDGRQDIQGFDLDTFGAFVQQEIEGPIGTWMIGAEAYLDRVDSFRRDYNADGSFKGSKIQGPVADDAQYLNAGAYVQHILPVRDDVELILGGRFNWFDVDANRFEDPLSGEETSLSRDFDALVGSARMVYKLSEAQRLFAGVSQGFRAPNLSDLTRLDTARSNEIETPSPDVDPEEFVSFEIGYKARADWGGAELTYYHTLIDDLIVRAPTGREVDGDLEVTKKNAGEGHVQGVELSGERVLGGGFSARGAVAWQDGESDAFPTSEPVKVREPISRLLPLTGFAALRYDDNKWWAEATLRAADKADKLSSRDAGDSQRIPPGGTPGHVVLGLRGGYEFSEKIGVTLSLENLADEDYRIHGSGLNEAGRNLIVSARYLF